MDTRISDLFLGTKIKVCGGITDLENDCTYFLFNFGKKSNSSRRLFHLVAAYSKESIFK